MPKIIRANRKYWLDGKELPIGYKIEYQLSPGGEWWEGILTTKGGLAAIQPVTDISGAGPFCIPGECDFRWIDLARKQGE